MSTSEKMLRIDIPVELSEVKAVFSIASLSFDGIFRPPLSPSAYRQ